MGIILSNWACVQSDGRWALLYKQDMITNKQEPQVQVVEITYMLCIIT